MFLSQAEETDFRERTRERERERCRHLIEDEINAKGSGGKRNGGMETFLSCTEESIWTAKLRSWDRSEFTFQKGQRATEMIGDCGHVEIVFFPLAAQLSEQILNIG